MKLLPRQVMIFSTPSTGKVVSHAGSMQKVAPAPRARKKARAKRARAGVRSSFLPAVFTLPLRLSGPLPLLPAKIGPDLLGRLDQRVLRLLVLLPVHTSGTGSLHVSLLLALPLLLPANRHRVPPLG